MLPRSLLPVAALFLACLPCAFGQLPKRLEKCLPYPTFAQEIREMQPAPAQVRVHVTRVEFDPNDDIPADAQDEISAELRSRVFKPDADSAYQKDLANEIAEIPVRGALRNRGYFQSYCDSQAKSIMERRGRRRCCCGYQCHARTAIPNGRHPNHIHG